MEEKAPTPRDFKNRPQHVIHRDIKPTNVMVTLHDGAPVVKVIDFGVAKATGGKLIDDSLSTQLGAVVGTLEYMSPEQARGDVGRGDGRVSSQSDTAHCLRRQPE